MDLHVKYRPQDFDEVVGQDHIINSLKEYEDTNMWPHAYLFTGPSGCAKTTLARIIARKLGCTTSPSLVEVDAATNSGVDHVRQLFKGINYTTFGDSNNRCYILDEAHALSKGAVQALLKTMEEPPENVYIFLCTTEDDKIPETIKTRCHVYNVKEIPTSDLIALLETVCELENIQLDMESIDLIAESAQGSARRSLTYLSMCRNCGNRTETENTLETSATDSPEIVDLCKLLLRGNLKWKQAVRMVRSFKDKNPESVRIVILNYLAAVLLNTDDEAKASKILFTMDVFSKPYNNSEKLAPLLLSIGDLVFNDDE